MNDKKLSAAEYLITDYLAKNNVLDCVLFPKKEFNLNDMPFAYSICDVVCMPSLNETFGMVFLESLLMRKPVIAARSGAAPEILKNNFGFLAKPNDVKDLARILEFVILNINSIKEKTKNARKYAKKSFSSKKTMNSIESLYNTVLSEKKYELYLIRHPQTQNNINNKYTGWNHSSYTSIGKNQFKRITCFFNKPEFQHFELYTSDLKRCFDLAKELKKVMKIKMNATSLLREQNFKHTKPFTCFETNNDFLKRTEAFIKSFALNDAVIVSHAGTILNLCRIIVGNKLFKSIKNQIETAQRDIIFKIERYKNHVTFNIIKT